MELLAKALGVAVSTSSLVGAVIDSRKAACGNPNTPAFKAFHDAAIAARPNGGKRIPYPFLPYTEMVERTPANLAPDSVAEGLFKCTSVLSTTTGNVERKKNPALLIAKGEDDVCESVRLFAARCVQCPSVLHVELHGHDSLASSDIPLPDGDAYIPFALVLYSGSHYRAIVKHNGNYVHFDSMQHDGKLHPATVSSYLWAPSQCGGLNVANDYKPHVAVYILRSVLPNAGSATSQDDDLPVVSSIASPPRPVHDGVRKEKTPTAAGNDNVLSTPESHLTPSPLQQPPDSSQTNNLSPTSGIPIFKASMPGREIFDLTELVGLNTADEMWVTAHVYYEKKFKRVMELLRDEIRRAAGEDYYYHTTFCKFIPAKCFSKTQLWPPRYPPSKKGGLEGAVMPSFGVRYHCDHFRISGCEEYLTVRREYELDPSREIYSIELSTGLHRMACVHLPTYNNKNITGIAPALHPAADLYLRFVLQPCT